MIQENNKSTQYMVYAFFFIGSWILLSVEPIYADAFKTAEIETAILKPIVKLVNKYMGTMVVIVGVISALLKPGEDMRQKFISFAFGALAAAAGIFLAKTLLFDNSLIA
jgi:hypothetical protein